MAREFGQIKITMGITVVARRPMQSLVFVGSKSTPFKVLSSNEDHLSPYISYLQSSKSGKIDSLL